MGRRPTARTAAGTESTWSSTDRCRDRRAPRLEHGHEDPPRRERVANHCCVGPRVPAREPVTRYRNWEELLAYCQNSANPVGRLVLYLCGYRDAARQSLSDATCTALQLANFWQDVTVDLRKDRVYIPLEVMERHGYTLEELFARRFTPAFAGAMREIVARARGLFLEGLPLAGMVDRRLAIDLDLFSRGGLRVLDKIGQQGYDVLRARPKVSRVERVGLLLGSVARVAFSASGGRRAA